MVGGLDYLGKVRLASVGLGGEIKSMSTSMSKNSKRCEQDMRIWKTQKERQQEKQRTADGGYSDREPGKVTWGHTSEISVNVSEFLINERPQGANSVTVVLN